MKVCLNWKVTAGLALVALGVWVVAPRLVGAALPLLLVAVCPLSMLFMMRGMKGDQCATRPEQANRPTVSGRTCDEQLAELKARLAGMQAQQQELARQLARLEGADGSAVREAEAIARMADEHRQERP